MWLFMAFWVNLCIMLLVTTVQQCYCQHSSNLSHNPKILEGLVLPVTRTDSGVSTANRFIRSKSQRTKQVADVMMIMDISTSLNKYDQKYQRQALRNLSNSTAIDIGKNNVRMGIVAFGKNSHLILPLDKGISRNAIYDAAAQVDVNKFLEDFHEPSTNFPDAMNMAKEQLAKARNDSVKVAVLVTDGSENCSPDQVFLVKNCSSTSDCRAIAKNCPRPPPGKDLCNCKKYNLTCNMKTAVFGEFEELKKAGGWQVTLAIIGVGDKITKYGRDRLNCWASERMYREVSSYSELEKIIVELVTTVLPADPHYDCKYTYYTNEQCHLDKHKRCGHYGYINITQNRTENGRPCPEMKRWLPCRYVDCGETFGPGGYTPVPEVVRATTPSKGASGVAWWVIFVALMGALALILVIAIIVMVVIRRQRVRRAVTAGVQPSARESLTERVETARTEMASQLSAAAVNENVQPSVTGVSRSVQPSTELLQIKQEETAPLKDDSGFGIPGRAAFVDTAASKSARELSKGVQPGESLMMPASNWPSPQKAGHKVSSGTSLGDPTVTGWRIPPKTVLQKTPSGALVIDATAAVWNTPSQAALRKASSGKVAKGADANAGRIPSKTGFKKSSSSIGKRL